MATSNTSDACLLPYEKLAIQPRGTRPMAEVGCTGTGAYHRTYQRHRRALPPAWAAAHSLRQAQIINHSEKNGAHQNLEFLLD